MSTSPPEWRPARARGEAGSWSLALAVTLSLTCSGVVEAWGDDLVIRPNMTLKNKTLYAFDEDGVRLNATARPISWAEIRGGTLARDQARFDRLRASVGEPLYQVHKALSEGKPAAALVPAEALFPIFAERRSTTAYLVSQALMWARIEVHRPEDAVEPYMLCLTLLETVKDVGAPPGRRRLRYDSATGLSPELPLVGFDRARAAAALPRARARLRSIGNTAPPGLRLYLAELALAAGDSDAAAAELAAISSPPRGVSEIVEALRAQTLAVSGQAGAALTRLESLRSTCLARNQAMVGYLVGTTRLARAEGDARDGVLDLLDVAAAHGDDQPVLAAAALYAAQKALDDQHDAASARSVRVELLRSFPETEPGARLVAELGQGSAELKLAAEAGAAAEADAAAERAATRPKADADRAGPAAPAKRRDRPRGRRP